MCFVHVNTVFSAKEKNCAAGLHCRVPTVAVETEYWTTDKEYFFAGVYVVSDLPLLCSR